MNLWIILMLLSSFSPRPAVSCELLLDPAFRGTVTLYAGPDKKKRVKTLRQHVKAEDWLYFEVTETKDSMFRVSAAFSIAGHVADGWIDKSRHIGVYPRVYEDGKRLIVYATAGSAASGSASTAGTAASAASSSSGTAAAASATNKGVMANKSAVVAKIAGYSTKLMPVTDCAHGWVKIRVMDKGREVEGWIPPEEQCADAYTMCN